MNCPNSTRTRNARSFSAYLWGTLAVLTCPCHLPVLVALLAGTTAGAVIGRHVWVAALTLTGLFVVSAVHALRGLKER